MIYQLFELEIIWVLVTFLVGVIVLTIQLHK